MKGEYSQAGKPWLRHLLMALMLIGGTFGTNLPASATSFDHNENQCPADTPNFCYEVRDDQGGRYITATSFIGACMNAYWWTSGTPHALSSTNGFGTYFFSPYTVFADATIVVYNCQTNQKYFTRVVRLGLYADYTLRP